MKINQTKLMRWLFSCLTCFTLFNLVQVHAQTQPSVTVKSYAQHEGSNIIFTYLVTNHGPNRLFTINIGCLCRDTADPWAPEILPQLNAYPVDYDFERGEFGVSLPGSYSAPANWRGHVAHYEDISLHSFEFRSKFGSEASVLPGQTTTFRVIVPSKDERDYVLGLFSEEEKLSEKPLVYDIKTDRGWLTGHFSYHDYDASDKFKRYAFPMQLLDTTAPTLTITPTPASLWPPNGKLIPVTAAITVKDDYDPQPEIKLESITSSEVPTPGDIQGAVFGTDDRSFSLAATRAGTNPAGRVYTLTYSATDASGNQSTARTTVTVPHDQR